MKQLLLRVDDDLHACLAAQARDMGVSVNSLANDILGLGIDPRNLSRRDRLRLRLMALGRVGANRPSPRAEPVPVMTAEQRERALDSMRGIGPIADDLIAYERDRP